MKTQKLERKRLFYPSRSPILRILSDFGNDKDVFKTSPESLSQAQGVPLGSESFLS
jgi:hypothetical protein